ncbi:MAG TPA: hypothetical protein VGB52_08955 [Actinomycetota bacterium]
MRKIVLALAVLGLVSTFAMPAQANHLNRWHNLVFTAGTPCAVACPYWLDTANTDIDGNGQEDIFFSTCRNPTGTSDMLEPVPGLPWTEGTVYDQVTVGPRPAGATVLIFEISPQIDFDSFICGTTGAELAAGANILGDNCDNLIGPQNPVPVGCRERAVTNAVAGARYILRVYNWSDAATTPGRYCFSSAGACS